MCYIRVDVEGDSFKRYGFSLCCDENDLLIFGGMRETNFIDGMIVRYSMDEGVKKNCIEFFI